MLSYTQEAFLIDSHCHLDDYGDELPAVLARAEKAGVLALLAIGIGNGPSTMGRALDLARSDQKAPLIFATAGIHPQEAHQASEDAFSRLRSLAVDPLCVAVGEIGLDYYHADNPAAALQQTAFVAQMDIATRAAKPIVIHCRTSDLASAEAKEKFAGADAWADLLRLIDEHRSAFGPAARGGIMHCFSGGMEQARQSVAAGFHLSFAGNITYPKSVGIREAAAWVPANRILIETDAPFLAPVPHRGKRNEPALVADTARLLAELRGVTVQELAAHTTENFMRLFPSTRERIAALL